MCQAWRINTTGIYDPVLGVWRRRGKNERGVSDIIGCVDGKFLAVEIKNKLTRDRPSKDQVRFVKHVGKSGGVMIVVDDYNNFPAVFHKAFSNIKRPYDITEALPG